MCRRHVVMCPTVKLNSICIFTGGSSRCLFEDFKVVFILFVENPYKTHVSPSRVFAVLKHVWKAFVDLKDTVYILFQFSAAVLDAAEGINTLLKQCTWISITCGIVKCTFWEYYFKSVFWSLFGFGSSIKRSRNISFVKLDIKRY